MILNWHGGLLFQGCSSFIPKNFGSIANLTFTNALNACFPPKTPLLVNAVSPKAKVWL
jgi:hypothetical protein